MECCAKKEKGRYEVKEADAHIEGGEPTRDKWGRQVDFLLSCIGYAVGLGNIWRFPYLCMRNGGGAFLIPYFTFMLLGGMPLCFMELAIGQYSSLSPLSVWRVSPLFKGLGWGMVLVSGIATLDYSIILSWVLYYLGMSVTSWEPVWASCSNSWNTANCVNRSNQTSDKNITTGKSMTPAEEFWQYNVLEMTDDIGNIGGFQWKLVICHGVSWFLVFLCLIRGVKSSGKVVYVTATLPYVFLLALFIRGVTLPGSLGGILYYTTPNWGKLADFRIWVEACLQIFFSLGPAWGGIITMASYNRFNHNIQRDAIIVPMINCGTSFFAGFVIFSVLGNMAHESGLSIEESITSGPGLAFIVYPEALARLPGAAIWSAAFFLMLLTIGLDTQFVTFETLTSGFVDKYPKQLRGRKTLFTGLLAFVAFVIGLLFTTRAGIYYFQIFDWYAAAFSVIVIAIIECLVLSYIYGLGRLYRDIQLMIGRRPMFVWKITWYAVTPILLSCCFVYALVVQVSPSLGEYTYPSWAIGLGWCIASISVIPIPVCMIIELHRSSGTFLQRLRRTTKPDPRWGSATSKVTTNDTEMEGVGHY